MMEQDKKWCTAVILAAGTGSRMHSSTAKQFLELCGKPLIYYALKAVEDSKIIDECILVTGREDLDRMRKEIVERFDFHKVKSVIEGGSERCFSVANAMRHLAMREEVGGTLNENSRFVFIHDGARPFLSEEILERAYRAVREYGACVAAMPSKDTVKIADENGFAASTPDRKHVWNIQTPQVFEQELIVRAYADFEKDMKGHGGKPLVTDDASVIERYTDHKVKLVEGSYCNMKVTTPEDLLTAEALRAMLPDGEIEEIAESTSFDQERRSAFGGNQSQN